MSSLRRHFLSKLLAAGTLPGFFASPGIDRTMAAFLDQANPERMNPDLDTKAYKFWADFLSSDAEPVVGANGQRRGGSSRPDDARRRRRKKQELKSHLALPVRIAISCQPLWEMDLSTVGAPACGRLIHVNPIMACARSESSLRERRANPAQSSAT